MKKLLTSLTALALVSAMVVPVAAFATEDSRDYQYVVDDSYTLTIPAVTSGSVRDITNEEFGDVEISNYNVALHTGVQVTVTSTNSFKMVNHQASTIQPTYGLKVGNSDTINYDTFSMQYTGNEAKSLTFVWIDSTEHTATTAPTTAGVYEDTVTFTASLY